MLTACVYVYYFNREERGALFVTLTVHFILANGLVVKNPPANAGDLGLIPVSGRCSGKRNGNHSSILIWEIPWTEEPDGLQSMGSQKNWT